MMLVVRWVIIKRMERMFLLLPLMFIIINSDCDSDEDINDDVAGVYCCSQDNTATVEDHNDAALDDSDNVTHRDN